MNFSPELLAFPFALGVIVFCHELGHLLVAKLFGVRVVTFSLGFGNRLWGFEHNGTDYRVSTIPLGGYVRMGGEMPDERTGDPTEFLSKPRWQRILVYLAGPIMNLVLSVGLIAGVFMYGVEMQADQDIPAVVGRVTEGSPAEAAGLQPGDRITTVDGKPVELWKDLAIAVAMSPERTMTLEVVRTIAETEEHEKTQEHFVAELTPVKVPPHDAGDAGMISTLPVRIFGIVDDSPAEAAGFKADDEVRRVDGEIVTGVQEFIDYVSARAGQEIEVTVLRDRSFQTLTVTPADADGSGKGKIGVEIGIYRRLPFGEAIVESVKFNVDIVVTSIVILRKLFTFQISPKSTLSGPVEIAVMTTKAAELGFRHLIYLMGFLSVSIGFMNLLPIPVLDGGHIFILAVESVMRRDLSMGLKERITQVGFMMLVTLMAVVIFLDLAKNVPGFFSGS